MRSAAPACSTAGTTGTSAAASGGPRAPLGTGAPATGGAVDTEVPLWCAPEPPAGTRRVGTDQWQPGRRQLVQRLLDQRCWRSGRRDRTSMDLVPVAGGVT